MLKLLQSQLSRSPVKVYTKMACLHHESWLPDVTPKLSTTLREISQCLVLGTCILYAKILTDRWLQVVGLLVMIIFASKFHIYLQHPYKYFLIAKLLLDFFREVPFAALHRSRHTPRPRLTPSWGNLAGSSWCGGIQRRALDRDIPAKNIQHQGKCWTNVDENGPKYAGQDGPPKVGPPLCPGLMSVF